jgi:hypothetical protein
MVKLSSVVFRPPAVRTLKVPLTVVPSLTWPRVRVAMVVVELDVCAPGGGRAVRVRLPD